MKKESIQEEYQKRIMDHGVAHLVYSQSGVQDILHPYSIEGYELLSDEFVSFLEKYRPVIPDKVPIVLEIVGEPLTEKEKETIDHTIWYNFCMAMTENDRKVKEIRKISFWYLLFTILSTGLVIAANSQMNEAITNLAYLPFYFFGYRMLIYLLIDSGPVWEQRKWYQRLASMKLIFSEGQSRSLEGLDLNAVSKEITGNEREAEHITRKNRLVTEYLFENGTAVLGCKVRTLEDLVLIPAFPGREDISDALSDYLGQAEPFLDEEVPVRLQIRGAKFLQNEQELILRAIKNYYDLRLVTEEESWKTNGRQIFIYGFFTLLSAFCLAFLSGLVSAGLHEFIIMLLCFFGDYLLEFIFITRVGIRENMKKLERLRDMEVKF